MYITFFYMTTTMAMAMLWPFIQKISSKDKLTIANILTIPLHSLLNYSSVSYYETMEILWRN